jgi:hypothetical protein
MSIRIALIAAGLCVVTGSAAAQDSEQLPPPKQAAPAPIAAQVVVPYPYPIVPPRPPRLDSRNAWSYFAPNYMGQMRYRVVQAPYGSYYLYNGEPYFGLGTRPAYILPKTSD